MTLDIMSDKAEFSVWSADEIELLDNIDREIKLISSESESSLNQVNQGNGESWKAFQKNESNDISGASNENQSDRQSTDVNNCRTSEFLKNSNIHLDKLKLHFSSNDLSKLSAEAIPKTEALPNNVAPFSHSNSCNSLVNNEKHSISHKKYDHVESKIKQYFKIKPTSGKNVGLQEEKMNDLQREMDAREINREDYLHEMNRRLTKELEEKNALLTRLQENYENLLLKYAEAQNKIDQLRLKSVCESPECPTHSGFKSIRTNYELPLNVLPVNKDHQEVWEDAKCPKASVAPFRKGDLPGKSEMGNTKIDRPSSLPLDPNAKGFERDVMKTGTPTDSEGVSSVITSMSGHSKILNTLEVQSPTTRDCKLAHYSEREFILEENSVVNDAFDKVKNWQNSLPPLELIETPETTLYDEPPMHISPSPNYGEMTSSPKGNAIDETLFISNHVENSQPVVFRYNEDDSQVMLKDYLRKLSLPNATRKKNFCLLKHQKRNHQPIELCVPENANVNEAEREDDMPNGKHSEVISFNEDVPSVCLIPRRRKKPPLLRCSSLPTYDYDSPKSANCRNVYVPPLDLENLTLSDFESSQVEFGFAKENRVTSSSYITSQSGSMDLCSQTCISLNNSCRGRSTDYTDSPPFSARPVFNKSTSITPDRYNEAFPAAAIDPKNLCHVCGEKYAERETSRNFPCRSNSYQSFHDIAIDSAPKNSERRTGKHPFNRSVSFNSETVRHNGRCIHDRDYSLHGSSQDSLEKFDIYVNNLKTRSELVMKALAAHVNNT